MIAWCHVIVGSDGSVRLVGSDDPIIIRCLATLGRVMSLLPHQPAETFRAEPATISVLI